VLILPRSYVGNTGFGILRASVGRPYSRVGWGTHRRRATFDRCFVYLLERKTRASVPLLEDPEVPQRMKRKALSHGSPPSRGQKPPAAVSTAVSHTPTQQQSWGNY